MDSLAATTVAAIRQEGSDVYLSSAQVPPEPVTIASSDFTGDQIRPLVPGATASSLVSNNAATQINNIESKKEEKDELSSSSSESTSTLPDLDNLREELSCAICLEVCFEPSTTTCGHSFCSKCLRLSADRCGKKCPKCRQPFSKGMSYTVNTELWTTIQILFPAEAEARKAATAQNTTELEHQSTENLNPFNYNYYVPGRLPRWLRMGEFLETTMPFDEVLEQVMSRIEFFEQTMYGDARFWLAWANH